jgi:hypothetical protein
MEQFKNGELEVSPSQPGAPDELSHIGSGEAGDFIAPQAAAQDIATIIITIPHAISRSVDAAIDSADLEGAIAVVESAIADQPLTIALNYSGGGKADDF